MLISQDSRGHRSLRITPARLGATFLEDAVVAAKPGLDQGCDREKNPVCARDALVQTNM